MEGIAKGGPMTDLMITLKFPMELPRFTEILNKFLGIHEGERQPTFNMLDQTLTIFDVTENTEKEIRSWINYRYSGDISDITTSEGVAHV